MTLDAVVNPLPLKQYLRAGLFSDTFKQDNPSAKRLVIKRHSYKDPGKYSIPPPTYVGENLRRKPQPFKLPYDVWWMYQNEKKTKKFDEDSMTPLVTPRRRTYSVSSRTPRRSNIMRPKTHIASKTPPMKELRIILHRINIMEFMASTEKTSQVSNKTESSLENMHNLKLIEENMKLSQDSGLQATAASEAQHSELLKKVEMLNLLSQNLRTQIESISTAKSKLEVQVNELEKKLHEKEKELRHQNDIVAENNALRAEVKSLQSRTNVLEQSLRMGPQEYKNLVGRIEPPPLAVAPISREKAAAFPPPPNIHGPPDLGIPVQDMPMMRPPPAPIPGPNIFSSETKIKKIQEAQSEIDLEAREIKTELLEEVEKFYEKDVIPCTTED